MKNFMRILALAGMWILSCETAQSIFPPLQSNAARVEQPSPDFTRTARRVIAGPWQVFYSWGCGSYSRSEWVLNAGGTFYCPEIDGGGTWTLTGRDFRLEFDYPPYAAYTGFLNAGGNRLEGTMAEDRGRTGCWYAIQGASRDTSSETLTLSAQ
jgi:hypothetical protein